MFEHLDDPQPPPSPERVRAVVHRTVRRRRRRRASVVGGVAVVAGLGGAAVVAARDRVTPQQVAVAGLLPADDRPEPGEPMTVLVVGIDVADQVVGIDGVDQRAEVDRQRTDTIVVLRIDPAAGEVRMLSVPRDLEVSIPGRERPDRVNTAFESGGPTALIDVLRSELGIEVDHYVQVDFAGAVSVMDALGGIRVAVDRPIRDEPTGLDLAAGCQTLDGGAALALGRARHVAVDGTSPGPFEGDLARQARSMVVAAALLQAAGRVAPSDVPALVETGLSSIVVDDSLELRDLVAVARRVGDLRLVTLGLPLEAAADITALRLGPGAAEVTATLVEGGNRPAPLTIGGQPVQEASGLRPC